MKKLTAIVALTLLGTTAHAEFWDGNRLLEKYTSSIYFEQGLAMGYIMGVADTTVGISHCAPPSSTAGQIQDMVILHLRTFPERRTRTADSLVIDTLRAAWPCPARNGRAL